MMAVFILFMQRRWRSAGQRAIIIVHDTVDEVRKPLTIVVLDPNAPRLTILPLPPEKPILPLLNYGSYPSQGLVGLTQLEDLRWEFLTGSLALEYGAAVDGIIWSRQTKLLSRGELRSLIWQTIANRASTTLAYWDRWQLLAMVEAIPDYKLDLSWSAEASADDQEKWASRTIQDNQIRQSGIAVAVQNAAGIPGLATRFARMARIMGFDVRNIENGETQVKSQLLYKPELIENAAGQWALQRLEMATGYLNSKPDSNITQRLRSDLVIILGTDWRDQLTRHPATRR